MPAVLSAMEKLKEDGVLESLHVVKTTPSRQDGGSGDALEQTPLQLQVKVVPPPDVGSFSEEERSRQPSLFSIVRASFIQNLNGAFQAFARHLQGRIDKAK